MPEENVLVFGVLEVLQKDPVFAAALRFLDLLLHKLGLKNQLTVMTFSLNSNRQTEGDLWL
jgi:hypothetical protein